MRMSMMKWEGGEVVKPSENHVNDVKKYAESGRCIGVGMRRKKW